MAGRAEYAVKMVISALDRASAPFRAVEARMAAVREKMSALSRTAGLNRVTSSVAKLGSAFGGVAAQLRSMAGPMLAIAGIGGIMGFGALISDTVTLGDQLGKLKLRTGFAVESIQKLTYAADMSGVSNEEMTAAIETFNKNIGDTANKVGKAQKVFKALKISIREPNGELKSSEKLLWEVQSKLEKIKDPAMKAAITSKLFGDSTGKVAGFLSLERDEIKKLMAEKERYGLITDEQSASAEAFNDAQGRLKSSFMGLFQTLASKVLPILQPFIDRMTEAVAAHRSEIVEKFSGFLARMGDRLAQIDFDDVIQGITGFFGKIETAIGWIGGFENAFYLIMAVMAGPLLAALASATSAVISLGVALMATPVGWFLAAVAVIAGAVYLIYDNWGSIVAWFTGKLDAVKAAFSDGFLSGLWELFRQFNPFTLWDEALSALINHLFGIDLSGYLSKQFEALTASLPDWAQGWFGGGETAKPPSQSGSATPLPGSGGGGVSPVAASGGDSPMMTMPPPPAAGPQKIAVESKGEMRVKLDLPPGMSAAVVGEKSSGPTNFSLDTGRSTMP